MSLEPFADVDDVVRDKIREQTNCDVFLRYFTFHTWNKFPRKSSIQIFNWTLITSCVMKNHWYTIFNVYQYIKELKN